MTILLCVLYLRSHEDACFPILHFSFIPLFSVYYRTIRPIFIYSFQPLLGFLRERADCQRYLVDPFLLMSASAIMC